MKKAAGTIGIIVVFLLGFSIMMYPTVSEWYNKKLNEQIVWSYRDYSNNTAAEERQALYDQAVAYNETLSKVEPVYVNGIATDEVYKNALDLFNGVMGYIVIEEIDVRLPVYHGTDEGILQKAVGHLEGSHLPTGGEGNHTVITGHTGLPSATLFTNISKLEVGSQVELYVMDDVLLYEVVEINVVLPHEIDLLLPQEGRDLLTLITCTPYGINSHRLLVMAERIYTQVEQDEALSPGVAEEIEEPLWLKLVDYVPFILTGIILLVFILLMVGAMRYHGSRVRGKDGQRREVTKQKPQGGRRLRR